jgi:hypothetical protein
MRDRDTIALPETLIVKAPEGFSAILKDAARRQYTTRSEYIRRAILAQLERDGCSPIRAA